MDKEIELKTQRLNTLLIREMMFRTNGYEIPENIIDEINELKRFLKRKDIVEKVSGDAEGLTTNK